LERRCGLLALALEWRCPPLEKTIDLRLDAAKYAVLEPCIALDTCLAQCILLTLPPDGLEIFHLPAEVGRDRRHLEMAKILTLGLFIGKSIFGTFWYLPCWGNRSLAGKQLHAGKYQKGGQICADRRVKSGGRAK